ncbi:MAG: helix-turn-helix transcriptional regulator, partial [Gemmatimonadetes bacterium]|nr:helix-turn-helix transcriptional regulator [Gemmatimonadota bacterium]
RAVSRAVRDELAEVAGRDVAVATVFVTLTRLEDRGLLASRRGAPPDRGGRAVRIFEVTEAGRAALRDARAAMDRMWDGVEPS